jgi:hypothetical protein
MTNLFPAQKSGTRDRIFQCSLKISTSLRDTFDCTGKLLLLRKLCNVSVIYEVGKISKCPPIQRSWESVNLLIRMWFENHRCCVRKREPAFPVSLLNIKFTSIVRDKLSLFCWRTGVFFGCEDRLPSIEYLKVHARSHSKLYADTCQWNSHFPHAQLPLRLS